MSERRRRVAADEEEEEDEQGVTSETEEVEDDGASDTAEDANAEATHSDADGEEGEEEDVEEVEENDVEEDAEEEEDVPEGEEADAPEQSEGEEEENEDVEESGEEAEDGDEEEDSAVDSEKEEDAQEKPQKQQVKKDDPTVVPKKGDFFLHDDRFSKTDDEDSEAEASPRIKKKLWEESQDNDRWVHDKFDVEDDSLNVEDSGRWHYGGKRRGGRGARRGAGPTRGGMPASRGGRGRGRGFQSSSRDGGPRDDDSGAYQNDNHRMRERRGRESSLQQSSLQQSAWGNDRWQSNSGQGRGGRGRGVGRDGMRRPYSETFDKRLQNDDRNRSQSRDRSLGRVQHEAKTQDLGTRPSGRRQEAADGGGNTSSDKKHDEWPGLTNNDSNDSGWPSLDTDTHSENTWSTDRQAASAWGSNVKSSLAAAVAKKGQNGTAAEKNTNSHFVDGKRSENQTISSSKSPERAASQRNSPSPSKAAGSSLPKTAFEPNANVPAGPSTNTNQGSTSLQTQLAAQGMKSTPLMQVPTVRTTAAQAAAQIRGRNVRAGPTSGNPISTPTAEDQINFSAQQFSSVNPNSSFSSVSGGVIDPQQLTPQQLAELQMQQQFQQLLQQQQLLMLQAQASGMVMGMNQPMFGGSRQGMDSHMAQQVLQAPDGSLFVPHPQMMMMQGQPVLDGSGYDLSSQGWFGHPDMVSGGMDPSEFNGPQSFAPPPPAPLGPQGGPGPAGEWFGSVQDKRHPRGVLGRPGFDSRLPPHSSRTALNGGAAEWKGQGGVTMAPPHPSTHRPIRYSKMRPAVESQQK